MKRCAMGSVLLLSVLYLPFVCEDRPALTAQAPQPAIPRPKNARGLKLAPIPIRDARHKEARARHGLRMTALPKNSAPSLDGRQQGWVPPIRDQANCGSCYLVSACDVFTMALIRAGYGKNDGSFSIASQYGMDCEDFGGCNGGDEGEVIKYFKDKGFPADADPAQQASALYPPYEAGSGRCRLPTGSKIYKLADWGYVNADQSGGPPTVEEMKTALAAYGPISIAIDAGDFDGAGTGVVTVTGRSIDHAVDIIGWDDGKQAYILRNQWNKNWGDNGYMWLGYKSYFVEAIWVSVVALPPPPPPVCPPGQHWDATQGKCVPDGPNPPPPPLPGTNPTIVLNGTGTALDNVTYELSPIGTMTAVMETKRQVDALYNLLMPAPIAPPNPCDSKENARRWSAQDRINQENRDLLLDIRRQLGGKP